MVKLKAAVIGLGRMGAEPSVRLKNILPDGWLPVSHAESILENKTIELVALCDNDEERLSRLGNYYGVKNLFTDAKTLIDEIKPDFLCVATRTIGRTDIIRYACENGVSIIYIEKPISRSIADCKSAINSCVKNKVLLGYGVNRRYHSTYRKAKSIVDSGLLGPLKEITIEHGSSTLFWSHPHSADLILFFSGDTEIEYIQGSCLFSEGYVPQDEMLIDDDPIIESAFLKFKNGVYATITQTGGLNVRLACEKGIVSVYGDGETLEIKSGDSYFNHTENVELSYSDSATVTAFSELVNALQENTTVPITPEEVLANMVILTGIVYSSNNNGKKISVSEIPEELTITGKSGNFYA